MAKPASKLDWTVNNPDFATVTTEPTPQKKQDGWFPDEPPPREFMNWLFFNIGEWVDYFEVQTDALLALRGTYDAIISPSGTHADINAVMADADTIAGIIKRVLVMTPQVAIVKQVINIDDMFFEFKPQATFSKGAAISTGIEISSKRVTMLYGRFSGFTDAGGDEAIQLTATSRNCLISGGRFFDNSNDIDDLGVGNVLQAISEVP